MENKRLISIQGVFIGLSIYLIIATSAVFADSTDNLIGNKNIHLFNSDNQSILIGEINIQRQGKQYHYSINFNDAVFADKFLSMRPFKCIDTPRESLCHQPYPYKMERYFTLADLTSLEYEFLFIFKTPEQFNSVDAWNGLYYLLSLKDGHLEGELHAVDLNLIMAPPETGVSHPITKADLTLSEAGQHPYQYIRIK